MVKWTRGWISVLGCSPWDRQHNPRNQNPPIKPKANIPGTQRGHLWPQKSIPNWPQSLRRAHEDYKHSSPWVQPLKTRSPSCVGVGLLSWWGFSCCSQLSAWRKASTICFLGREYGITVNDIEKLDSFTAVIIDLPICLGELAAGKK